MTFDTRHTTVQQTVGNVQAGDGAIINIGISLQTPLSIRQKCLHALAFPHMRIRGDVNKAENTCQWILHSEEYLAWRRNGGLLFLKGRAGTGKTTLMTELVDQGDEALSFFFYRRGSALQSSTMGMYRSLLHQMLSRSSELLDRFCAKTRFAEKVENEGEYGKWEWQESVLKQQVEETLSEYLKACTGELFVDALDESGSDAQAHYLMRWFDELRIRNDSLKLCVSCRPYPDVVWSPDHTIIIEECNREDIVGYVHKNLETISDLVNKTDIMSLLIDKAKGVFQWVTLVLPRALERKHEGLEAIVNVVKAAPQELSALYDDILMHMDADDGLFAFECFRWITFACRALSVSELRMALAADPAAGAALAMQKESDYTFLKCLERISRGLVVSSTAESKSRTRKYEADHGGDSITASITSFADDHPPNFIAFNHESVSHYMKSTGIWLLQNRFVTTEIGTDKQQRQALMALHFVSVCLCSLTPCFNREDQWMKPRNTFDLYAFRHWTTHAQTAEACATSIGLRRAIGSHILQATRWPNKDVVTAWADKYAVQMTGSYKRIHLQHVAAAYGLICVLEIIHGFENKRLVRFSRWNSRSLAIRNEYGLDACLVAASSGQISTMKYLLGTGRFDIDRCDESGCDLWGHVVKGGHIEVVQELLQDARFNVNRLVGYDKGRPWHYSRTALHHAATHGDSHLVTLCLEAPGIEVNVKCGNERQTALHCAVLTKNTSIIRLLLEDERVDVNVCARNGWTALHMAAYSMSLESLVLLMLCDRFDMEKAKRASAKTPLAIANASSWSDTAEPDHDLIFQLLGAKSEHERSALLEPLRKRFNV